MTARARTLAGLVRARAQAHPDRVAIRFRDGAAWPSCTWGELWAQAERAARGLHARGIRPGDHVLMLVPEVGTAVTSLFGLWALGAVPSILGVPYRLTDLDAYLLQLRVTASKLHSKALVLSQAIASMQAEPPEAGGGPPLLVAEELEAAGAESREAVDPDAAPGPCVIQLTSGSTGHPRGVVIPHERVMLHMASMSQALPSREQDAAVSWLPLHHDMGLLGGLLFPLFNNYPAHLISPLDFRTRPLCWLEAMSELKATGTAAPPSAFAICIALAPRAQRAGLDLSSWEVAMIGAEPISPQLLRDFARAYAPCGFRPEAFFPVYGLAEATVAVTFPGKMAPTRVDRIDRQVLEREGQAVPCGEAGHPLELTGLGGPIPNTELQVVDDQGRPLPDRRQGEVLVRSATMMQEYYDDPAATAEAFSGEWLRTGDLGYLVEGTLFITGRKKELIIKGGHNLVPSIVEEIAAQVDGVRAGNLAAVGVRSEELETELCYLVAETKLEPERQPALQEAIRDRLKAHGIAIDRVVLVPPGSLPKTTSGKIRRRAVAEAIARGERPE